MQDPSYKAFMDRWLADMAANTGNRVPGPEQATLDPLKGPVGWGGKPGFQRFPKSRGPKVPPYSAAQVRKTGGIR